MDNYIYKCAFCETQFKRVRKLVIHTRIHTGVKPHKCNTCDEKFVQKCELKTHEKLHVTDKCSGTSNAVTVDSKHLVNGNLEDHEQKLSIEDYLSAESEHSYSDPEPYTDTDSHSESKCINDIVSSDLEEYKCINNVVPSDLEEETKANVCASTNIDNLSCAIKQTSRDDSNVESRNCNKSFDLKLNWDNYNELCFIQDRCAYLDNENLVDAQLSLNKESKKHLNKNCNSVKSKADLKLTNTKSKVHSCELCEKTFKCQRSLSRHTKAVHDNNLSRNTAEVDNNKQIIKESVKGTDTSVTATLSCEKCGKCFKVATSLKKHACSEKIYKRKRSYVCTLCSKAFTSNSDLIRHERVHSREKPYFCNICGKSFGLLNSLNRHVILHTDDRPWICETCGKTFRDVSNLKSHKKSHNISRETFACGICSKILMSKSALNLHQKGHTGIKPYKCITCDRRFFQKITLIEHARTHTGEKPYSCNDCGKNFGTKNSLLQHQRVHSGQKSFICEQCGFKFTNSSGLSRHRSEIHAGEKKYKCPLCNKRFTRNGQMKAHMKTHSQLPGQSSVTLC